MENIKMEDIVETAPTSEVETAEETVETPAQDPLKTELEKVRKLGRTELEKANFTLKKNAERVKELGDDPAKVLGLQTEVAETDDDAPVTRKDLKEFISAGATKNALQLADEIPDETERELVRWNLQNRVIASGNPQEDLRDARRIVNSIKNEHIVQEIARKSQAKSHSNGSSGEAKTIEAEVELTPQELAFMKPPFSLSKAQILKARQG